MLLKGLLTLPAAEPFFSIYFILSWYSLLIQLNPTLLASSKLNCISHVAASLLQEGKDVTWLSFPKHVAWDWRDSWNFLFHACLVCSRFSLVSWCNSLSHTTVVILEAMSQSSVERHEQVPCSLPSLILCSSATLLFTHSLITSVLCLSRLLSILSISCSLQSSLLL